MFFVSFTRTPWGRTSSFQYKASLLEARPSALACRKVEISRSGQISLLNILVFLVMPIRDYMEYPRWISTDLHDRLDEVPAVVLLGPRQTGKTTMALDEVRARDAVYLDLESELDGTLNSKLAET